MIFSPFMYKPIYIRNMHVKLVRAVLMSLANDSVAYDQKIKYLFFANFSQ